MTKKNKTDRDSKLDIHQIMSISTVIPVVNIDNADDAVPLANALLAGGVGIIEVTLRTPAAMESIERIVQEVPDMCVGAGTVWTRKAARKVRKAGVHFVVSPGRTDAVYKYCRKHKIPLLPGAQTASEIALWVERGFEAVKFFPAEVAGGLKALKAFSSVFGELKFCPTGGISSKSAPDYLALPSIPCVGGSWLVDKQAVKAGDWHLIEAAARAVSGKAPSVVNEKKPADSSSPPWD